MGNSRNVSIEDRLTSLGKELPEPTRPVANYLGSNTIGDLMYVSGHVSQIRGEVGTDVSTEDAATAAEQAMLACLGTARDALDDFDQVECIVRLTGYVRVARDFVDMPNVINGASDLLVTLFERRGRHARAAIGVTQLPFGASVEIEMILKLRPDPQIKDKG